MGSTKTLVSRRRSDGTRFKTTIPLDNTIEIPRKDLWTYCIVMFTLPFRGPEVFLSVGITILTWQFVCGHRYLMDKTPKYYPLLGFLAHIHPMLYHLCMFGFAVTDITHHSKVSFLDKFAANVTGTRFSLEYKSNINMGDPVLSEYAAIHKMNQIEADCHKSASLREWYWAFGLVTAYSIIMGQAGTVFGLLLFVVLYILSKSKPKEFALESGKRVRASDPINIPTGIYGVMLNGAWGVHHAGIGYARDGTFTTKYHVTSGNPITINGIFYEPSYINKEADVISYGSSPIITDLDDGDEVFVALSGPYSNSVYLYKSRVTVTPNGLILFYGSKSMEGSSGSPVFTVKNDEYHFAGCIGWVYNNTVEGMPENANVQLMKNTNLGGSQSRIDIRNGCVIQHFSYPGSGKTRTVIPNLTQDGLSKYGRIFLVGPTRVVVKEIYHAMQYNELFANTTSLQIKGERPKRGAKVVATTHGAILSMIVTGDPLVQAPALWIIDESHFQNESTQCLKFYLRDRIRSKKVKGCLVELTATGYDLEKMAYVNANGSNYPIEDVIESDEKKMMSMILEEDRKCIIFVPTKKFGHNIASKLVDKAQRLKPSERYGVVQLSRETFNQNYDKARDPSTRFIITTSISECGANFEVEVCYDFQRITSPHYSTTTPNLVTLEKQEILKSQAIQRRGRVGRRFAGVYVAPKNYATLRDADPTQAVNVDTARFCKAFDITPDEPGYNHIPEGTVELSLEQIKTWISSGEEGVSESPGFVYLVLDSNGAGRTYEGLKQTLGVWKEGEISAKDAAGTYQCSIWDCRNEKQFSLLAAQVYPERDVSKIDTSMGNVSDDDNAAQVMNRVLQNIKTRSIRGGTAVVGALGYGGSSSHESESEEADSNGDYLSPGGFDYRPISNRKTSLPNTRSGLIRRPSTDAIYDPTKDDYEQFN